MSNIPDFNQFDGFYTIGDVQTKLKEDYGITKPIPTLRNWVNDLHQHQIHTLPRNSRGERIFRDKDIDILRYISEAKQRYGNNLSMAAICQNIAESEVFKDHLNYDATDGGEGAASMPTLPEHRIREFLKGELDEIKKIQEELIKTKSDYESKLLLLPDPETERLERMVEVRTIIHNRSSLERRVRVKLREKAEQEWNKNPVKRGILFKTEDTAAKVLFIEKYIDEHMDSALEAEEDKVRE